MKLYIYGCLDNEKVPEDTTHAIVDDSVTVVKMNAFESCKLLVSVSMGDNVKRIEDWAFSKCHALRFIRLSKRLEYIGDGAFLHCRSLQALVLPATLNTVEVWAFGKCQSLILLILPNGMNISNVGADIIRNTSIHQIAKNAGVAYEYTFTLDTITTSAESNHQVNEWLFHHMDNTPFHKLCYNSSITTQIINDYLTQHGNDLALAIDTIYGTTPLHMLSMNPHAPPETIAALLDVNMEVVFCLDNQQRTPLDYARDYNVGGLVGMLNGLCNHRKSSTLVASDKTFERASKRRKM